MLDVIEGDLLTVSGRDYPIKSVAEWSGQKVTPTFRRLASLSAATKRSTKDDATGKRTAATTHLSNLTCTPLDPVSAELASSMGLDTPHELKQCFLGDTSGFVHVVIEDLKR
jgi:hypothetical protein